MNLDNTYIDHAINMHNNFYLAYQMQNDVNLQVKYANLLTKILKPKFSELMTNIPHRKNRKKIKIGVISPHLFSHNGCAWSLGWLKVMPKSEFELYSYNLGDTEDLITEKFKQIST